MPRYRLDIEYDGSPYAGWQRQADRRSVQEAIETAIFAFTGETVTIRGAGRTDAGVHASAQVAHVDLTADWKADKVQGAMNAHLNFAGDAVAVLRVQQVDAEFDARFSATARHYVYRIVNRRAPLALEARRAWHVARRLDAERMHEAAQTLLGRHDFTTFRSVQCQANSPIRTLDRLDVVRTGDVIEIFASARSFLHNQVRSMVGTLKRAGEGAWSVSEVRAALDAADRSRCGTVAPPDGLYLCGVDYGEGVMPSSD